MKTSRFNHSQMVIQHVRTSADHGGNLTSNAIFVPG